jgi:ferredoxin
VSRRITIDEHVCIGSANCEYWAPDTFEVDDDTQKSVVIDPDVDDDATVQRAAKNCPTGAIRVVVEDDSR